MHFFILVNLFDCYNYNTIYFLASFAECSIPDFLNRITNAFNVNVSLLYRQS